ncbi:PARP1 [Acrasis kona]|uniref:NAD(+) ADP-ribosyltransferase n=1 Tax=Acrasis kona TaxID=1008807 RepID=A0AAW2YU76_9EUKA
MLELNNQNPKGEAALPERCAYGMMFGALPKCDREGCKDNFLEYSASTGKYCCTGHNEWSKCTYEADVDDIQTKDWVMPDDYDDDFINNFKFIKHKKVNYVRLLEGFSVLKKIQEKLNQQTLKVQELEQQDEQRESKIKSTFRDAFIALSNKFYTKIPHVYEKNSSIPLIDSDHFIQQFFSFFCC